MPDLKTLLLLDAVTKGGPGSGVRGHSTPRPEQTGQPQPKLRGRALAVREGRVGSKVRYPKRVQEHLEQLARGFN